jgi:nicotinate-nucleotide adenylyltransferase
MVEAPLLDISATYIRQCIKEKKSIRYLVPEPVEQMIRVKGFYI